MQRKAAALLGGVCPAKKKAGSPPAADMLPSKRTVKKALNAEKGAFCMSRKNKFSSELKKKVVRMCKSGQVSQAEAARRCGVSESTIKRWLSRERSEGCAGLESEATNRVYPSELKLQAVTAYLTGKYSQQEICCTTGIRGRNSRREAKSLDKEIDKLQADQAAQEAAEAEAAKRAEFSSICISKILLYTSA